MVLQFELVWMMALGRARSMRSAPDRGDGILIWVVMTALLVGAAVAIVTIVVGLANNKASKVQDIVGSANP
jgi:hypothetical protein